MKLNVVAKFKALMLSGCSVLLLAAAGCDNSVDTVKNGCMEGRQDITVGAIMEQRFSAGTWVSKEESGRKIVYFQGKIRKETHDLAVKGIADGIIMLFCKEEYDKKMEGLEKQFEIMDKKLDEKRQALYKKRTELSDQEQLKKIEDELYDLGLANNSKKSEMRDKLLNGIMDNFKIQYWQTGSPVEFRWVVYPDGKRFELIGVANDFWQKINLTVKDIQNVVYSKY